MTEPQNEVLVNPSTGMPETREERDRREAQLQERQKSATGEADTSAQQNK